MNWTDIEETIEIGYKLPYLIIKCRNENRLLPAMEGGSNNYDPTAK